MERKTENYVFSMVFLAPKDENRRLEDLPQANFGRVLERFLLIQGLAILLFSFINKDNFSCQERAIIVLI